jgi:hypothetical protein
MFDPFFDFAHPNSVDHLGLGHEYLLGDSGQLLHVDNAAGSRHGGGGGGTGGGGGSLSTLVGSSSGLQIDLLWESSVTTNANAAAIESAIVQAATIYTNLFTAHHEVVNIQVGFGDVNGTRLGPGALGESETSGYITSSYSTVESLLSAADQGLVNAGLMSPTATAALQGLTGENIFIPSAEAKAIGLVSATGTGIDGYIGLTSSGLLALGATIGASQYDIVGVAAHEISEVMGRIGMIGGTLSTYHNVYTPLDIFRYSGPNQPAINAGGADYFSLDNGATLLNTYNNPTNGGDASDWATLTTNKLDAFDAFDNPGVRTQVTGTDLLEVAALGYQAPPGATFTPVTA